MKQVIVIIVFIIVFIEVFTGVFTSLLAGTQPAFSSELPADKILTLESALAQALSSNPEIAIATSRADAEHSAIRAQYSLDNPRLGLMKEKNLSLMEGPSGPEMGTMNLWSLTQEIKFPAKYVLMGSAQKSRAQAADSETFGKKLEIRKKVISAYYGLFVVNRTIALYEAQRESLREVARSAESRHAAGTVPQQDEMKAHVEQTKIEAEIISVQEEKETAEASLVALLNQNSIHFELPKNEIAVPKLTKTPLDIRDLDHSKSSHIKMDQALFEEASTRKSIARWNYAPDFAVSYKKAFSGAPADNYAIGIELSIPLWFFMKQSSEAATASAQVIAAEKNLERSHLDHTAQVRSLTAKLSSYEKLLLIYQTALIPQTSSTLNSSRLAYQAGRTSFIEFLDSERTLYSVRIAYYRTLLQFVETLTELEMVTGHSISTLPQGDLL